MAIRVFVCQWSEQQTGDGLYITNPIDTYLNDGSLSAPVVGINFYARLSLARRPDKLFMVKVMRGDLTAAEWTTLAGLSGVRMLPAGSFDRTIASVPTNIRNQVYTVLDANGIPRTTWTSAATVGGFLRNVLAELDPGAVSFGSWETLASEWA